MAEMLQKLYEEYKTTVNKNIVTIGQFESAFRVFSYIIAGRFEDSTILSELLYSASNLLVLFNDTIIKKASGILPKVPTSQERLKNVITVLEHVGVFVEVSAERMYGEFGRWVAIAILQFAKCICRFLLFMKHDVGIQAVPPVSPIDREAVIKQRESPGQNNASQQESPPSPKPEPESEPSVSFVLKRSGKTMRALSTAEPIKFRDWKIPGSTDAKQVEKPKRPLRDNLRPSKLSRKQAWGEIVYILKPIIHRILFN
ncbi:peroxisomal membrane protein pex16-like [Plakobranchus ocellatus]|uniref:Peroxisomal membrane protein PEX16 n=1 Tax=Plakobranchus ocellatus TaxID=259542 RepID=A0AAV3YWG1_9GAST|nr:peroxisomal membrane protein pex16-like [Plakobranchus ocellatus]